MDIEKGFINQEKDTKIPLKTKCYEFWFINNPLCFLWLWLLSALVFTLIISEYYKIKSNIDGSNIDGSNII